MDFEEAKENIQPLASGRNATILHASLRTDSVQELQTQRRQLEDAIRGYEGDDPLEAWYAYISWIEQSYPSGGKESGLDEVLAKCLQRFESETSYFQDRRMIKLYMKFIDSHKNPTECYQQLFNAGIGTMVADFYICWAYYYDLSGNTRKADEIFRRGIECRAEPLDELKEAHQHFGFSVAQRLMYQDDEDAKEAANQQLYERRIALTSLRGHRRKATVGSIRTGNVVKSIVPGKVKLEKAAPTTASSTSRCNTQVRVFKDENENPNLPVRPTQEVVAAVEQDGEKSVVRSIIDKAREQENLIEPGPWSKAYKNKTGRLFSKRVNKDLAFSIHEDGADSPKQDLGRPLAKPIESNDTKIDKPFKYPSNFKSKNRPLPEWDTPVTIENESNARSYPKYNKCMLYPRPNMEYQPEELRAYRVFKRCGITNNFTERMDRYWSIHDINGNIRQYPNFAKHSNPQKLGPVDDYFAPSKLDGKCIVPLAQIYNSELREEFQLEELMAMQARRNVTIIRSTDMEETICGTTDKLQRRKSFFPSRKSIAPRSMGMPEKSVESLDPPKQQSLVDKLNRLQLGKVAESNKIEVEADGLNIAPLPSRNIAEVATIPPPVKPSSAFEIFQDPTQTIPNANLVQSTSNPSPPMLEDKFTFKTPALPPSAKSSKLPFEIFEEPEKQTKESVFDPEETCSTQTFNIFLKSQPMSTPKPQRIAPRQFGSVLKEIVETPSIPTATATETTPPTATTMRCAINDENAPRLESSPSAATAAVSPVVVAYSPTQTKQLSTILETSEHGTTQGTHTTGASTKSTISSPEFDLAEPTTGRPTIAHPHLETVEELSQEASAIRTEKSLKDELIRKSLARLAEATAADRTSELLQSMQDPKDSPIDEDLGTMRLQSTIGTSSKADVPIVVDHHNAATTSAKAVGNFTRLENKEDTIQDLPMRSLRFQEDKTETITKTLFLSRQDDKTETISKMLLNTRPEDKLQEDKPPNVSSILGEPPALPSCDDVEGSDDSFGIFCKSPPKAPTGNITKSLVPPSPLMSAYTPLKPNAKRVCQQDTPIISLSNQKNCKSSMRFKVDDVPTVPPITKSTFTDYSLQLDDLSFVLPTQKTERNKESKGPLERKALMSKPPLKLQFTDCSLQLDDLSFVLPTQKAEPSKDDKLSVESNIVKEKPMPILSDSMLLPLPSFDLPPGSARKDPAKEGQMKPPVLLDSFLSDFSYVKETQSHSQMKPSSAMDKAMTQPGELMKEEQKIVQQSMLMDSFMKDFSANMSAKQQINSSLKFLNESRNQQQQQQQEDQIKTKPPSEAGEKVRSSVGLKFLSDSLIAKSKPAAPLEQPAKAASAHGEDVFELNAETAMFSTNVSAIKNSTWLPSHTDKVGGAQMKSLEPIESSRETEKSSSTLSSSKVITAIQPQMPKLSFLASDAAPENLGEKSAPPEQDAVGTDPQNMNEMSIYYAKTPPTPNIKKSGWESFEEIGSPGHKQDFVYQQIDLDVTNQTIENICLDPNLNPFNVDLKNALLDQVDFITYLQELPNCQLVGKISQLRANSTIRILDVDFEVQKAIGEGAYGAVYLARNKKTRQKCALKQERPPNYWELYICLEVQARLNADEMLPAFMHIDYTLIGNNASVLVSSYAPLGSLISVCNKFKRHTNKTLDEYVVILLTCEVLEIVDHLHSVEIIHGDLKADNFLLMDMLTYPNHSRSLQLIDFGISVDMRRFREGQTFRYCNQNVEFKCIEMRENRPWTYQLDLYGLAGVIHVLLFGMYMDVEKRANGIWMPKTRFPRYFNKVLWDTIFQTLLNVRDCNSMPNLQSLRTLLKEELLERERIVVSKLTEFNLAMQAQI